MRPLSLTIITFLLGTSFATRSLSQSTLNNTANGVLQKVLDKLNSRETISYNYYRSINYFSENYHSETSGATFLDFKSIDTTLGFKYQFENNLSKYIYNGAESFSLNKKDSTIRIKSKPKHSDFVPFSFFVNSVVTLKNSLPALISDTGVAKTLSDTIINQKSYHLVSLILENRTIDGLGSFSETTIKRNFLYKIAVDKETFLPHSIIQTNDAEPKDYMLTSFTEFKSDVEGPTELSWYYSTYKDEYKPFLETKLTLIKQNTVAPDWQSVYFNSKDVVTLSKLKGNVVLLEFWIKNCGYCIAAVPKLNALMNSYKSKTLQVIGINMHDNVEDMSSFYQKSQPSYKTVEDSSGKITSAYGVDGFPTVVLIDKKGIVLYAGSFDQEKLEGLLKIALR